MSKARRETKPNEADVTEFKDAIERLLAVALRDTRPKPHFVRISCWPGGMLTSAGDSI